MERRTATVLAVAMCALLAVAVSVAPAAAAPGGLKGTFRVLFPKGHPASNAPCPPDEFCGVGRLVGYGKATITILDETFAEIPDSPCLEVTRVEAIDLIGSSDELILDEEGTLCPPGRSGGSHAGPNSYGHPGFFRLDYEINGGESSGLFAGASGTGHERFKSAGAVGLWRLSGDLTLAD
jgi:hypothetical protein